MRVILISLLHLSIYIINVNGMFPSYWAQSEKSAVQSARRFGIPNLTIANTTSNLYNAVMNTITETIGEGQNTKSEYGTNIGSGYGKRAVDLVQSTGADVLNGDYSTINSTLKFGTEVFQGLGGAYTTLNDFSFEDISRLSNILDKLRNPENYKLNSSCDTNIMKCSFRINLGEDFIEGQLIFSQSSSVETSEISYKLCATYSGNPSTPYCTEDRPIVTGGADGVDTPLYYTPPVFLGFQLFTQMTSVNMMDNIVRFKPVVGVGMFYNRIGSIAFGETSMHYEGENRQVIFPNVTDTNINFDGFESIDAKLKYIMDLKSKAKDVSQYIPFALSNSISTLDVPK